MRALPGHSIDPYINPCLTLRILVSYDLSAHSVLLCMTCCGWLDSHCLRFQEAIVEIAEECKRKPYTL